MKKMTMTFHASSTKKDQRWNRNAQRFFFFLTSGGSRFELPTACNLVIVCLTSLLSLAPLSTAVVIDNGVVGQPTISCGEDLISVWIDTAKPFTGKIFVKGESETSDCYDTPLSQEGVLVPQPGSEFRVLGTRANQCPPCPLKCNGNSDAASVLKPKSSSFKVTAGTDDDELQNLKRERRQNTIDDYRSPSIGGGGRQGLQNKAHLAIKMGTCNMKRQRQINPSGVAVEFTAVISFHQFFITKVDRAYRIRCFYMEADKTVSAEIGVSMPETTELIASASMPVCEYSIRRGAPDGPQVKYVQVGEEVYHRWECKSDNDEMFGLLVHSCYVDDGRGQKVQLIDDKGCSIDAVIINDLTYDSFMVAHVESHVFKFADRTALDFQCAIGICVTAAGGCQGVTPPNCSGRARDDPDTAVTRKARDVRATNGTHSTTSSRARKRKPSAKQSAETRPKKKLTAADWEISAPRLTVVDLDSGIQAKELAALESTNAQEWFRKIGGINGDLNSGPLGPESLPVTNRLAAAASGMLPDAANGFLRKFFPSTVAARSTASFSQLCLSVAGFGILVAISTAILTIGVMLAGTMYVLRRKAS